MEIMRDIYTKYMIKCVQITYINMPSLNLVPNPGFSDPALIKLVKQSPNLD